MADIRTRMLIKFGLAFPPSEQQIEQWVARTEAYIKAGFSVEEAGQRAAMETFTGFGRSKYAAQEDTIATLLEAARRR